MSDETEDLWPKEFPAEFEDPEPVKILRGQASLLSKKTEGAVEGVIVESTIESTVWYSLYLRAPALGEYMYKLLSIAIPLPNIQAQTFPEITAHDSSKGKRKHIKDSKKFKEWLRSVLQSEEVTTVVGSMKLRATKHSII